MVPVWLTVVAWLYLSACFCCAGIIGYDIAVNHRRQPMGVMNFVYPITALYFGPVAVALYWRWGRAAARTATPPIAHDSVQRGQPCGGQVRVVAGPEEAFTALVDLVHVFVPAEAGADGSAVPR